MSNIKKQMKKNIKNNEDKAKEKKYPIKDELVLGTKIVVYTMLLAVLLIAATFIIKGEYSLSDSYTKISYTNILAGEMFNKGSGEYYVVLYDFNNKDMTNKLNDIKNSKVYRVDLRDKMNASIISDKSNISSNNIDDFKVKDATLIKIKSNKITDSVETIEKVQEYLNNLK